jgi:hypothetical protein
VVVRPGTDVTKDGGALIEVIDHGLGMSAERLAEENARLIRRERLDLVPTKVLGLFVVGSLARLLGVRVTLSRTPGGGVTGTVWIPATLLLTMSPVDPASPRAMDPTGSVAAFPTRSGQESEQRSGQEAVAPVSTPKATPPTAEPLTDTAKAHEGTAGNERSPSSVGTGTERPEPNEHGYQEPQPAQAPAPELPPTAQSPQGLPRRIPARTAADPSDIPEEPATDASRPLRRRVRGATLARTTPPSDRGTPAGRPPVDADAVRSELDEFEAAVRRAERDSALSGTEPTPSAHQENQKESGSDHVDR